jgi:GDP-mannose 6-dehydrogenase
MQLSVFGLAHLGAVTAGCLASQGHEVIAVDPDPDKVSMIRRGVTPVNEPGLGQLVRDAVRSGRLRASSDIAEAVASSILSNICGGASGAGGELDASLIGPLCEAIGAALRDKAKFHSVVVRSGLQPGAIRSLVIPILERASGKRAGVEFGVGVYPEFLRPSTAVEDYANPPAIILGATDEETLARLREMDIALQAPELVVDLDEAEAIAHANGRSMAAPLNSARRPLALPNFSFAAAGNICSG